jgi:hypothetical protein
VCFFLFLSDSFSVLCGDILSTFALLLLLLLSKHACFINSRHNTHYVNGLFKESRARLSLNAQSCNFTRFV